EGARSAYLHFINFVIMEAPTRSVLLWWATGMDTVRRGAQYPSETWAARLGGSRGNLSTQADIAVLMRTIMLSITTNRNSGSNCDRQIRQARHRGARRNCWTRAVLERRTAPEVFLLS